MNDDNRATIVKPWFVKIGILGVAVIAILAAVAFWGYQYIFQIPAQKQAELEIEFKKVAAMPDANLVNYDAHNKPVQALVDAAYLTKVNTTEIFKHYDEQLKQQGWKLRETKKVMIWGKDLGGKSTLYCKGQYAAEVYYAGQQEPDKFTIH